LNVRIGQRAELMLDNGVYIFDSLELESGGIITLPEYGSGVTVFVTSEVTLQGDIDSVPGLGMTLAYLGADVITVETEFFGRLVAPHANVVIARDFHGEVSAADLEILPDVVLDVALISETFDGTVGCGNGREKFGEACEDGNRVSGDGCDEYCNLEVPLEKICGDGLNEESDVLECSDFKCAQDAECGPYHCLYGSCVVAGSACTLDEECGPNLCEDGVCTFPPVECTVNDDCPLGRTCVDDVCVEKPTSDCSEDNAIDIGPTDTEVTVPTDACIMVRDQFPTWWDNRIMQLQTMVGGDYPIPFTWENACAQQYGEGEFTSEWHSLYLGPISSDCAMLIDLQGVEGGTVTVRYFAN
jgi:cysteine-rich repeat protein